MKLKKKEDLGIRIGGHIVLVLLTALAILPFWLLISASFSDPAYATREGYRFFPAELSLEAYQYIFQQWAQIGRAYGVTILVTVLGTVCSLFLVSTYAYALTKDRVRGVKLAFALCFIPMLFNGGVVSQYLIYSNMLKIKNTLFALIVPNLLFNGFSVILVRNYFKTNIPAELLDAAELDGATGSYIFFHIKLRYLSPTVLFVTILSIINSFKIFREIYLLTGDYPYDGLYMLQHFMNNMFKHLDYQRLSAAAVFLAIVIVILVALLFLIENYFGKDVEG